MSSLAAIGPSAEGRALLEDAEPRPLTNYGRSKLAAERAVRASRLGTEAVILRPAVVYGPRDTDVCHIFRAASRGLLIRIGREESWISIIYVKDLVDALIAAATSEGARGGTYFAANAEPVSWTEVASTAARLMGRKLRTISVPPRLAYLAGLVAEMASRRSPKPSIISREKVAEARCRYWICDTSRARSELDFSPRHSLWEGIAETLAWYKDAGWLTF